MNAGLCVVLQAPAAGAQEAAATVRAVADHEWARRADGVDAPPARAGIAEAAYAGYVAVRQASKGRIADVWPELRAAHYLIDFTDAPDDLRERVGRDSVALVEKTLGELGALADGQDLRSLDDAAFAAWRQKTGCADTDLAMTYFWSAIVWGAHSQRLGLLAIVREGVARKLRDFAEIALRLDPTIERGGSQRLLSRIHGDLPRVPFISGWVDRDRVVPYAEQALAVDPGDPGNKMILALAWIDRGARPESEARKLLEEVAALQPRPELLVEDLTIRSDARERLAELVD